MRNLVCLALLVPAVMLAAGINQPVTAIAPEQTPVSAGPVARTETSTPAAGLDIVGTLDTIGGSVYDWGFNGPAYRMLVTSPDYGVHALFMYSLQSTGFTDRNMRYNFYDFATRSWNWIDPDYMASGINTFSARSGFGSLDANPATGVAVVSCHQAAIYPVIARDVAPGAGIFEYCSGQPNLDMYQWPPVAVSQSQTIHLHMLDNASQDQIYYSRGTSWCNWDPPIGVAAPQPDPTFPTQAIAASKVSNKVVLTWVYDAPTGYSPGFYRESQDDGATWGAPTEIPVPAVFGTDTTASFHITGIHPWYDSQDRLHYVAPVMPMVRDTGYILPIAIMHWSEATGWVQIHRADTDSLLATVGYNALFACRPQIAQVQGDANKLHVVWEQFDGTNVEPVTNLCRADVYHAYSADGGATWTSALKLTDRSTMSNRFPCIADPVVADTVMVLYEQDLQAGFIVQSQGNGTNNPFVVQKIPYPSGAVSEGKAGIPRVVSLSASPNPVADRARISYALPRSGAVTLQVFDAAGRPVQTLVDGRAGAGRYTATWDASNVAGGVYFYTLTTDETSVTKKLIVAR